MKMKCDAIQQEVAKTGAQKATDVEATDEEQEGQRDSEEGLYATSMGGDLGSAVLGVIKGMVGPAILYLPHGFAKTGYALALPILLLATSLYLYSQRCLLQAWRVESMKAEEPQLLLIVRSTSLSKFTARREVLSFPELAHRAFGLHGETAVKTGIALMQAGICLTYLIFVPHNLHTSIHYLTGHSISPRLLLIVMVGIQIPLSWIQDIRKLAFTNCTANVLILYGLMLCLCFAFHEATGGSENPLETVRDRMGQLEPFASEWWLFVGTSVLLFEGSVTLLVPLQESVILEEDRRKFAGVYPQVIMAIIGFYIFFGMSCWVSFGNDVNIVLKTSLPSGLFATSVQLAYSLAVILTFPLQSYPALEIAAKSISYALIHEHGWRKDSCFTRRSVISSFLVIALAIVAVTAMNSLDRVIALMGSLLGCPVAFVIPPLIHTQLCQEGLSEWRRRCNTAAAIAGVIAMTVTSIATTAKW